MDNNIINGACFYCPDMTLRMRLIDIICRCCKAKYVCVSSKESLDVEGEQSQWVIFKVYYTPTITVSAYRLCAGCYICDNMYDFILKCRSLCRLVTQIPKIKPCTAITNLPKYIQELARYNCVRYLLGTGFNWYEATQYVKKCSVNTFSWDNTKEGHFFWYNVYAGNVPADMNKALLRFDIDQDHYIKHN